MMRRLRSRVRVKELDFSLGCVAVSQCNDSAAKGHFQKHRRWTITVTDAFRHSYCTICLVQLADVSIAKRYVWNHLLRKVAAGLLIQGQEIELECLPVIPQLVIHQSNIVQRRFDKVWC